MSTLNKTKKVNRGKAIVRAQYASIIGDKKARKSAYNKVKTKLSYPELCQAADFIDKNVNKIFQEPFYGNPLPKTYKELGKSELPYTTDNLVNEINWALVSIRKYAYEINLFLVYKNEYEKNLLTGNYNEAEKYLEKIESEICVSLWSLENRFLLKEFTQSSSDNKDFLSQFNEENEGKIFTKSLAHYLSMRAEKALSVNRFNGDLEVALSKIEGGKAQEHKDYYLFKLSFLNHLKFSKFPEIVGYDFEHSIIDRYLTLVKVVTHLLTIANASEEPTIEEQLLKQYVLNRVNYLLRKINDPTLFKLKLLGGEKLFVAFDEAESRKLVSIVDNHTTGLYNEVEEDLKTLLLDKPMQFDLYELYITSLIYQKKPFRPLGMAQSIQNQILSEMFRVISVTTNLNGAGINLLRIANNLSSCVLSYGITDFVFYQTKGLKERKLFAKLSFDAANPALHEVFPENNGQLQYLQLLKAKFPTSITIEFLLKKIQNSSNLVEFEKKLPEVSYKTEFAKSLQKEKQFNEASKVWEFLYKNYQDTPPVLETVIKHLYTCYEELGRYDDCIRLFVDSFLLNTFIVEKIEVSNLVKKIKENRFKIVTPSIELPIFYTINNADENEMHTAFERFNLKNQVAKPSELLKSFGYFNYPKILYYLKYTCGPEVLKHSIHITGSKERLEERLKICQFLREKDIDDKDFYEDEIKQISNILVIQKGLLELDESKIYVNEQGIVTNELKEYEGVFLRFSTIAGIADKNKRLLFKKGRLTTMNYTEETEEVEKIEYSSNPVYDIYKELFDAIKDKFLHSQFGIVAYLSTRIRHGVLLGEIRPIFEKHKLITLKEGGSGLYRNNNYWDMVYGKEPTAVKEIIQRELKDFSYRVDGLIFDLIKKYLQVYNQESNPDGWFNYDFKDEDLFWFSIRAIKAKDFNHFAQQVFEILWDRTDQNLNTIREKIQTEIADLFNAHFDALEKRLVDLLGTYRSQSLIDAVKSCSTETHNTLMRISSWFKRSGTSASDFQLDSLINIVMEYTNKSHSHKKILLERDIRFEGKIKGAYLTHFADLIRIFFENILKHSDESVYYINAKIIVEESEPGWLTISIENEITNKESLTALKNVWVGKSIDTYKLISEGKSGYHKASKILVSDLQNNGNWLMTKISEAEDTFSVTMGVNINRLAA